MRYFRSTANIYLVICDKIDKIYNYPNIKTKTQRALPEVNQLKSDNEGRVYLMISSSYCDTNIIKQIIDDSINNGDIEEITQEEYTNLFPPLPQPPEME